jgi:hypothetical protein
MEQRKEEMKLAIAICLTAVILAGCSGGSQTLASTPMPAITIVQPAQAQNPAPTDPTGAGLLSELCMFRVDERDGFLLLKHGPCDTGPNQDNEFISTRPLELQNISVWTGTPPKQLIEVITRLDITTPDGHSAQFYDEFDKHMDVDGMHHNQWAVKLSLPAGTKFRIRRTFGGAIACPNQGNGWPDGCLTEIQWRLVGSF